VADDRVRSTIYLTPEVHRALRLKAAREHRSISEIVNEAVQARLGEGPGVYTLERPANEQTSYDELLARLQDDLLAREPWGTPTKKLIEVFRHLPDVDPVQFRADIDELFTGPDGGLLVEAQKLTGLKERNAVVREALRALIERESARRLALLGGTEPALEPIPRRRTEPA
jgi:hypothetical protein